MKPNSFRPKFLITLVVLFLISCEKGNTNDSLVGVWRLTGYEDTSTNTRTAPPNGSEPITITFTAAEFKGDTGRNTLSAVYTLEDDVILIRNLGGTEINESDWGRLFVTALVQPFDADSGTIQLAYVLSNNQLKIRYDENKFMNFRGI